MQIKIYFYIQWPWDNNATGIVVEYQLIVAAPSYVSRRIKGDVQYFRLAKIFKSIVPYHLQYPAITFRSPFLVLYP